MGGLNKRRSSAEVSSKLHVVLLATLACVWRLPLQDVLPSLSLSLPSSRQTVMVMADNRWNDTRSYLSLSSAINRAYAVHREHAFHVCDYNDMPECAALKRMNTCKLYCLRRASNEHKNAGTMVYLDSDAVVRNFSIGFDKFVENNVNDSGKYHLFAPADCGNYQVNSGILVWRIRDESSYELLDEWIRRSERYLNFPFEQQALKDWINEENSTILDVVKTIPYGPETWHVGSCRRGRYVPPKFVAHITGRWKHERARVMSETIMALCPEGNSSIFSHCRSLIRTLDMFRGNGSKER